MKIKYFADSNFEVKGVKCIRLESDEYFAVISPLYGSAVWRMYDCKHDMEIFRWSESVTAKGIGLASEVWGLPTLYLPNRLDGGMLKTSDGKYRFPVNERKTGCFLHGWVHKRAHIVEKVFTNDNTCCCSNFIYT